MYKIGVAGAAGKVGKNLIVNILAQEILGNCTLSGGTVTSESAGLNVDLGKIAGIDEIGLKATSNFEELVKVSDCIIDFTSTHSSLAHLELCVKHKVNYVCGTTGFNEKEIKKFHELARVNRIFYSPNMSFSVALLTKLVEVAAKNLDDNFDCEIIDIHHNQKLDSPSGTAIMLGQKVAEARGLNFDESKVMQNFHDKAPRKISNIGFASIRGGDVVGEHDVMFLGQGERIELKSVITNRSIFAKGAIKAALWLKNQPVGKLYSMEDILTLS
jgi:4-hydroxy-tetrahydrodipicolinate reductase